MSESANEYSDDLISYEVFGVKWQQLVAPRPGMWWSAVTPIGSVIAEQHSDNSWTWRCRSMRMKDTCPYYDLRTVTKVVLIWLRQIGGDLIKVGTDQ